MLRSEKSVNCLIFVAAFAVFATGAFYGLPQQWDPDEQIFVSSAIRMLANRSLDPEWYGAPASTLISALAVMYGLTGVIGLAVGIFSDFQEFNPLNDTGATIFFSMSRIFVCFVSAIAVVLIYKTLKNIGHSAEWRIFGVLIFSFSPMMVQYSALIRMDMLQLLFNLCSLTFCMRYVNTEKPFRNIIYAGICLGLAVASKYPAAIGAIPIVYVCALRAIHRETDFPRFCLHLLAAGAASILAAFAVAPYLFINFAAVYQDVLIEARPTHLSATSPGFIPAIWFYLGGVFPANIGAVFTIIGCAGMIFMFRDRKHAVVPIFFFSYLLFIASLNLAWSRWAIPLFPCIVIGGVYLLSGITSAIRTKYPVHISRIFTWLVIIGMPIPLLMTSIPKIWAKLNDNDTRALSEAWIDDTYEHGDRVLLETAAPALSTSEFSVFVTQNDEIVPWASVSGTTRPIGYYGSIAHNWQDTPERFIEALTESNIEIVAISNFFRRFAAEADRYPREARFYETIMNELTEIERFEPGNGVLGPTIVILAPERSATDAH